MARGDFCDGSGSSELILSPRPFASSSSPWAFPFTFEFLLRAPTLTPMATGMNWITMSSTPKIVWSVEFAALTFSYALEVVERDVGRLADLVLAAGHARPVVTVEAEAALVACLPDAWL